MLTFYSSVLLDKKGPLSKLWLAALWEQKLKRSHIYEVDIESSVKGIISKKIFFDLRTTGHLLLGISKIYSRKTKYLLTDCNDIFIRIKMAFRPGIIDLPLARQEADFKSITLPEMFHSFEEEISMIDLISSSNQIQPECITLLENLGTMAVIGDDLDGISVDELEALSRLSNIDDGFCPDGLMGDQENEPVLKNGDDCFEVNGMEIQEQLFIDEPEQPIPCMDHALIELNDNLLEEPMETEIEEQDLPIIEKQQKSRHDVFYLEPYQATTNNKRRVKRKRKLIVDQKKNMPYLEIQSHVEDTHDIVSSTTDFAPPTKRLMLLKEIGGAAQLFLNPGHLLLNKKFKTHFQRCKKMSVSRPDEESSFSDINEANSQSLKEDKEPLRRSKRKLSTSETILCKISHAVLFVEEPNDNYIRDLPQTDEFRLHLGLFDTMVESNSEEEHIQIIGNDEVHELNDTTNFCAENFNDEGVTFAQDNNPAAILLPEEEIGSIQEKSALEDTFQERISSMIKDLQPSLDEKKSVPFSSLVKSKQRMKVAQNFYTLLMLKKLQVVELEQQGAYQEIDITKGERFDSACAHFMPDPMPDSDTSCM